MTKKDFIHLMSEKAELNTKETTAAYDAFLDVMHEGLKLGKKISFIGFGTFSVVDKPARIGRNPRTGESIDVPAKRAVKFKAGSNLKDI